MSLIGFRCPDSVPTAGRDNDPSYCINECPARCLPAAILAKIWNVNQYNEHRGDMISPSVLGKCPRSLVLERTTDYYQEPTKLYHAVRGSLIHAFLERVKIDGTIKEQRIYKTVTAPSGITFVLSGKFDYVSLVERTLEDYKSTQEKAVYFLFNEGAKTDHIWQQNIYRWLMKGGHLNSPDGEVINYEIDRIVLHYMTMGRIISTGSTIIETYNEYSKPRKRYKLQRGDFEPAGFDNKGRQLWKAIIDIPDVPLYPDEEIEAYIMRYGPELVEAFKRPPSEARHILDEPDKAWMCDWCACRDACMKIEADKGQLSLFDSPVTVTQLDATY